MSQGGFRVQSPLWYRRRSAVFALVVAIGFLGGWLLSRATEGRYQPAFATVGAYGGTHGALIAALCAFVLVIAAMLLRVWGSSYLSAATTWDQDAHTEKIIVAGPFRFVRHPLYLGNLILAVGLGAAAPVFGWIFIVVAFALFITALIRYEDRLLAAFHGAAFEKYRHEVPGLVPRLSPARVRSDQKPSLTQGLRSEAFTTFQIAGVVGFFAAPPHYGGFVLAAAYVVGTLVQMWIERH